MHISTKVEKCLVEVILEVYKNLLENPAYAPPSSREIKVETMKRLNKKYLGGLLIIALGTVQMRLQKLFGPEFYEKHYPATFSEKVEQFLKDQAYVIDTLYAKEHEAENLERGHKNDDPDAGKRDTPLSGKVWDDCVRDVAKTPLEQGKPRVNPFF